MNILKRILGFFTRKESPPPPQALPKPVAALMPTPSPRSVAISWQEMLDGCARISGYILRPSSLRPETDVSGAALLDALAGERLTQLSKRRKAVVPITKEQWSGADFRSLASPNVHFLLSANDFGMMPVPEVCELAQAIRTAGINIAVDLDLFQSINDANLSATCLFVDMRGKELASLEKQLAEIRQKHPALIVVVDGVGSWSEYRFLISLDVSLCAGQFSTSPDDAEQADRISQSRQVVIEMLNMLRGERDISEIASVAKRDPAVVLKLLEMANSPLSGLQHRISSIEDALMLLGRDSLYRWLSLAMFRIDGRGARDETLMVIALSRAAFLEKLAPASDRHMSGELFLVGMLSLIDSLLSMPIEKVLDRMHLPAPVALVLLKNEGPYARYLMLALSMERCRIDQASALCPLLGIDLTKMVDSYSESMAWATADTDECLIGNNDTALE